MCKITEKMTFLYKAYMKNTYMCYKCTSLSLQQITQKTFKFYNIGSGCIFSNLPKLLDTISKFFKLNRLSSR